MDESHNIEKKSLKLLTRKSPDFFEIVRQCICFANSRGGTLLIGVEDDENEPPRDQKIDRSLVEKLRKFIPQHTHNVGLASIEVKTASNGAEYIDLQVYPSSQSIASTSDGRYYMRVSDDCLPVMPDQISRLAAEKNAFVWELQTSRRIPKNKCDQKQLTGFLEAVRSSDRVSGFSKQKSDDELLEHYLFVKDGLLTNLGTLWIGEREDRAGLRYAPTIQFIRYDERESKVKKITYDDFTLNPLELLDEVYHLEDWNEAVEIPAGLFRDKIPIYDKEVVRELLANALAHRVYVMQGEVFINLYPDRLEVHSPGLLPLGVTPSTILHQSVKRNEHLAKVFYDLKLMEREGSGYDRIYERLLADGKRLPVIEEKYDRVVVTVFGKVFHAEVVQLMEKVSRDHQLKQKELITLGLIAQHTALTALELTKTLALKTTDELQPWIGGLLDLNLVLSKGRTKGKEYFVNPELLRKVGYKGKTTLKQIELPRLMELIRADLKMYPNSAISEIHERIGKEIPRHKVRQALKGLVENKVLSSSGKRKGVRYSLSK